MSTEQDVTENFGINEQMSGSYWYWKSLFNWTIASSTLLNEVESRILSYLDTPYRTFFVEIGAVVGESDRIWTIALNTESKGVPLVLLHGLGGGIGLWVLNLDELSANQPVYAIDILGFGRSSRPNFSRDALECEEQFVNSLEAWCSNMNVHEMILLGHSMGGFIAASYALTHPQRVKHLILADPWGFPTETLDANKRFSVWVRTLARFATPLNPLFPIRAAGPFGKWLVCKVRPDIVQKFSSAMVKIKNEDDLIAVYLQQCNTQAPTGESAFHSMLQFLGCAKHPMENRIQNLDGNVPITFIHGTRSWVDPTIGEKVKSERRNSFVDSKQVTDAGHHVYADNPEVFNEIVKEVCSLYKLKDEDKQSTQNMDQNLNEM